PKLENELIDVTRRARDAAVEYEFLGPNEKAWMRRLIFVYPWVKGATRFAGQFPREHPGQLAIGAQLSKQAAAQQMQDLGPVPATYAGIIKVGGPPDRPLIVAPRGAAIFQTPAEVLQAATAPLTGNYAQMAPSEFLGPTISDIAFPLLTGR